MLISPPAEGKSHTSEIQKNLENGLKKVISDLSIEYEKTRVL